MFGCKRKMSAVGKGTLAQDKRAELRKYALQIVKRQAGKWVDTTGVPVTEGPACVLSWN